MVTNLNKTKNPPQKPNFLRRAIHPRYHSNYGKIRHFPGSDKPFAFTQQYGRSLLGESLSVLRLGSDRSYGMRRCCLAPTASSLHALYSDPLRHSRFCDIQICTHYSTIFSACQYLFRNFFGFFDSGVWRDDRIFGCRPAKGGRRALFRFFVLTMKGVLCLFHNTPVFYSSKP